MNVSGPLTCTNPVFVHRVALAGHGVVLGPSYELGADIAEGRLVQLLRDWQSRELSIYALYPHRSLLTAKVRSFVEFLAERFASRPEWERGMNVEGSSRKSKRG